MGALILFGAAMVETKTHFDNRLNVLGHKHKAMTRGYTTHMRNDGLIVVKELPQKKQFPIKGLVLLLLGFFCFKGFMLAAVGQDAYAERVASLQSGTFVEQGGAWVMQADPVAQVVANYMGPILR